MIVLNTFENAPEANYRGFQKIITIWRFHFYSTESDTFIGDCRRAFFIIFRTIHHPSGHNIIVMNIIDIFPIQNLTRLQKVLCVLSLLLPWAGIAISLTLHFIGITENEGEFIWGCVVGSCVLAALALLLEKKDIVSIITPFYTAIIFFGIEIPWTIFLQFLYSCTLTVLLWRLLTRFAKPGEMQYA